MFCKKQNHLTFFRRTILVFIDPFYEKLLHFVVGADYVIT